MAGTSSGRLAKSLGRTKSILRNTEDRGRVTESKRKGSTEWVGVIGLHRVLAGRPVVAAIHA